MKRTLGGLLVGTLILLIGAAGSVSAKQEKVYVCHAAGQAGTTHFVTLHVPATDTGFPQGHFTEDGTPEAGHEDDYLGKCQPEVTPSPTPTSTPTSTPSPTPSASPTPTPTPSVVPTSTPTVSPSLTPEPSPSSTSSPSSIPTLPPTDTASGSNSGGPSGLLLALGIITAIAGFSLGFAGLRSRVR